MDDLILKLIQNLGVPGLITLCIYRLADEWAGRFLEIHDRQATAITNLAKSVEANSTGQQDVIMAVRVLSGKVEECIGWLRETRTGSES